MDPTTARFPPPTCPQRLFRRRCASGIAALALSACSGGGGETPSAPPGPTVTPPTPAALQAELAAYRALAAEPMLARVNAAQAPALRAAADWSGLTEALGGAAATEAALAAGATATRRYLEGPGRVQFDALLAGVGLVAPAAPGAATGHRATRLAMGRALATAGGDSTGLIGLTGSYFAAALFNGLAANSRYERDARLESSSSEGAGSADMSMDISRARARYGHTVTLDDAATNLRLKNITALDAQLCPDANGAMTLKFGSDSRSSKLGDDSTGVNTQVDVTLQAQLDDNAAMRDDPVLEIRVQQASFQASRGVFVDVTYKSAAGGGASATVNRASSAARPEHVQATEPVAIAAMLFSLFMAKDMETAARGGRCVTLDVQSTPAAGTVLAPSAAVQIVASPRSALDGGLAPGLVSAQLSGGSSITPTQAQADATFAYVAPAFAGQASTVALESRSRRGVGKATLVFSTGAVVARYSGSMSAQTGIPGAISTQTQIDQITWTLTSGSLAEALVYRAEGTARVTTSVAGCSVTRTLDIDPATSQMTVFGPDERPDGRQKGYFAQVNTVKAATLLSCATLPQPMQVELQGVFRNGCDSQITPDPGLPRYVDIRSLSGSRAVGVPCNLVSAEPHSWTLQAVP